MYKSRKNFLFSAFIGLMIGVSSCKDPENTGLEILPSSDLLNVSYSDTATINSFTVREDSLSASGNSANLVGSYTDPLFGISRAGFFTQLAPLTNSPNFGVEAQADSVVLSLAFSGFYGDTTTGVATLPQTFQVYQVTQDLFKDTTYYSNAKISFGTLLGSQTLTPSTTDSVWMYGKYEAPQLQIHLDTAFFRNYILNQSGQSSLASLSSFQTYFKGIYVTTDTTQNPGNRIFYFNLASTISRLHVYYHNAVDTGVYDLQMDAKNTCSTINHFEHNYVGTPVASQLADSSLGVTNVYLQAMAGLKTKIKMPYLKNYLSIGRIAINKAELILTVDDNFIQGYGPVTQLAVQGIDSLGNGIFTGDYFESITFRGGTYNSSTKEYSTNITRYVQQVLTGKVKDYGLYLVVYGGSVFANRSVLTGSSLLSDKRIKIKITYSLLN